MKHSIHLAGALCAAACIAGAAAVATASPGSARTGGAARAPLPVLDSLASPAGAGAAEPDLGVGPDGAVYMTWLEPADSGHALRFAKLTGRAWSAARTIRKGRDFFVNWADFPSIQVLGNNRLAVHWLQRNGTGTYAYGVRIAQSRDGGVRWSAPVTPHRDSAQAEHGFVAMWREADGVSAVWLDGRKFRKGDHDAGNEMMLMTTRVNAAGVRGAEIRLDERTCDCCQNSAAMTSSGPIIAYRNRSPDEIRDIYVTRRVGGKWTTGVAAHNDYWKIAACPVNGPAIDARGTRVALAWFTAADSSPQVKVAFSDNAGARFAAPVRVDGGQPAGRVDLVMLEDGSALVTWIERIGGDAAAVRVRRVNRNGTSGAPVTVASSSAARASGVPRMVQSGNDVVFAWTVPGRPSQVRVARTPIAALR
jgi:hypothetical protein